MLPYRTKIFTGAPEHALGQLNRYLADEKVLPGKINSVDIQQASGPVGELPQLISIILTHQVTDLGEWSSGSVLTTALMSYEMSVETMDEQTERWMALIHNKDAEERNPNLRSHFIRIQNIIGHDGNRTGICALILRGTKQTPA